MNDWTPRLNSYPFVLVLLECAKPSQWASVELVPPCAASPCAGGVLQMCSHKSWIDRKSHFPWPHGCFGSVSQHAVGILGVDALLVHTACPPAASPHVLYAKVLSRQSVLQPLLVHGVTPSQGTRFCLPLLTMSKVSPVSEPAESSLNSSQPFSMSTTAPDKVPSRF